MREKRVAILGSATGWREAFKDTDREIWALNDMYMARDNDGAMLEHAAHITRWFELHGDTPITRSRRHEDHWRIIDNLNIPVYTLHDVPVRQKVSYPIEAATAVANRAYFACTTSYQIALALSEDFTSIDLYGICLTSTREALVERPCVEWWLGLAEGRGVKVSVNHPWNYGLGRHLYRYALDDDEERRDTYAFATMHTQQALPWLIAETKRLNLTPDPVDYGKDIMISCTEDAVDA